MTDDAPKAVRSGSNTRQRQAVLGVRLTAAERAQIEAQAARAGLALGSHARRVLLGAEPPRQARRPSVEAAALSAAVAQLGRVGSNLNQLARRANEGRFPAPPELAAGLAEVRAAVALMIEALGRKP